MKIITYQSKNGRVVGTAKLYEKEVGERVLHDTPRDYYGKPYQWNTISQKDKEQAKKSEAKLYNLFNRKCYKINYSII
jgi:hypothetical protein